MVATNAVGERPGCVAGGSCDVHGWVSTSGVLRSPPHRAHWSLSIDTAGRGRIGNPAELLPEAAWAVAGFGGLLREGVILPDASDVRHPRTAAGLDLEGRWFILVVVDGRQPGYREGMTMRELAD